MQSITRILLIICGTCSIILGFIGMFLPVLPTTPFLLLASVCYARSSATFSHWLLTNRCCGEYIRNYREGKGIRSQQKIFILLCLWATIGYSIWVVPNLWMKIGLLVIACCVTIHLMMLKTA